MRSGNSYQPPAKKQKTILSDANRAEEYRAPHQPGRVHLEHISWHPDNRGRQGILPFHVHTIALNIAEQGTSIRRYGFVRLVEVPVAGVQSWFDANRKKAKQNPLLSDFSAMSQQGPYYANLSKTHFTDAQKVIKEGERTFMNDPYAPFLQLRDDDDEGHLIQKKGVKAIVYTAKLWDDKPALLTKMREDNFNHVEEEAMSHKAQEDAIELREGLTGPKALPVACASCLRKDETISELREAMSHKDVEISRLESRLQCRTEEMEEARKKESQNRSHHC